MIKTKELDIYRENTESLHNGKPPKTKTQLWSFLGLCNVCRRFMRDITEFARLLNVLLKKGAADKFEFNEKQLE